MRVIATPPAGPSSASGSVARTGTRAWGRASGLGVRGVGECWPTVGTDTSRSSVTQGRHSQTDLWEVRACAQGPRDGGPAPSLQSALPPREQAQSSAPLTRASSFWCVLPLRPWALGGWPEAAAQLRTEGAPAAHRELLPGHLHRKLRPHAGDPLLPARLEIGALLPPGPPERARPLLHEGRWTLCCGVHGGSGTLFLLLPPCPGPWSPVSGGPFSPCPCLQGTEPTGAQGHRCGLRAPCRGALSSAPCASPRAAHLLSVSLPSPVTP